MKKMIVITSLLLLLMSNVAVALSEDLDELLTTSEKGVNSMFNLIGLKPIWQNLSKIQKLKATKKLIEISEEIVLSILLSNHLDLEVLSEINKNINTDFNKLMFLSKLEERLLEELKLNRKKK